MCGRLTITTCARGSGKTGLACLTTAATRRLTSNGIVVGAAEDREVVKMPGKLAFQGLAAGNALAVHRVVEVIFSRIAAAREKVLIDLVAPERKAHVRLLRVQDLGDAGAAGPTDVPAGPNDDERAPPLG